MKGRLCSDGWDNNDAKVFCKDMGSFYVDGVAYHSKIESSSSQEPYWATQLGCDGTESNLEQCQYEKNVEKCDRGSAAAAKCLLYESGE